MNANPEGMALIECRVDGDPRLIAGAAVIVAHIARRAGLSNGAASDLAGAAVQTCQAVLESQQTTESRTIRLLACELPNSIEVSVEPAAASSATPLSPQQCRDFADRVRQTLKSSTHAVNVEIREGLPRVTLVTNCGVHKHPFAV